MLKNVKCYNSTGSPNFLHENLCVKNINIILLLLGTVEFRRVRPIVVSAIILLNFENFTDSLILIALELAKDEYHKN